MSNAELAEEARVTYKRIEADVWAQRGHNEGQTFEICQDRKKAAAELRSQDETQIL
jgi:hypothetical protein